MRWITRTNQKVIQNKNLIRYMYLRAYERVWYTAEDNSKLEPFQKHQLKTLLLKFKNIFSDNPGLYNQYTHSIEDREDKIFNGKTYPVPLVH